jgi:hypothetical protein
MVIATEFGREYHAVQSPAIAIGRRLNYLMSELILEPDLTIW